MRELEKTIEINASPERVWEVLSDFDSFPDWNPFIQEIEGTLSEGEQLTVRMQAPGMRAMTLKPKVLRADPNREFRWLGKLLLPRVFDGEHYFVIDDLGDEQVRFTQGEEFRGALVPVFKGVIAKAGVGFEQMNDALKQRAEAAATASAGEGG